MKFLKRWFSQAAYRIELKEDKQGWWWQIVSINNGHPVATSETYSSREKADQTAQLFADATALLYVKPD